MYVRIDDSTGEIDWTTKRVRPEWYNKQGDLLSDAELKERGLYPVRNETPEPGPFQNTERRRDQAYFDENVREVVVPVNLVDVPLADAKQTLYGEIELTRIAALSIGVYVDGTDFQSTTPSTMFVPLFEPFSTNVLFNSEAGGKKTIALANRFATDISDRVTAVTLTEADLGLLVDKITAHSEKVHDIADNLTTNAENAQTVDELRQIRQNAQTAFPSESALRHWNQLEEKKQILEVSNVIRPESVYWG